MLKIKRIFIGPRYTWGPIYGSESLKLSDLVDASYASYRSYPSYASYVSYASYSTDVTLADEETNSILTDNANRAIQGNVT